MENEENEKDEEDEENEENEESEETEESVGKRGKIRKTRKPRTDGFLVFRLEGGVFIVVLPVSDRQARRLSPSLLWAHLCVSMPQ